MSQNVPQGWSFVLMSNHSCAVEEIQALLQLYEKSCQSQPSR